MLAEEGDEGIRAWRDARRVRGAGKDHHFQDGHHAGQALDVLHASIVLAHER